MGLSKEYFKYFLTGLTAIIVIGYAYIYFVSKTEYGDKYLPLIITGRTILLASFLLFFYNPLRTTFEYGPSMPFFAFSAGISLLFLLKKYDILNFVHFILYWEVLPEDPRNKSCDAVEENAPGLGPNKN